MYIYKITAREMDHISNNNHEYISKYFVEKERKEINLKEFS